MQFCKTIFDCIAFPVPNYFINSQYLITLKKKKKSSFTILNQWLFLLPSFPFPKSPFVSCLNRTTNISKCHIAAYYPARTSIQKIYWTVFRRKYTPDKSVKKFDQQCIRNKWEKSKSYVGRTQCRDEIQATPKRFRLVNAPSEHVLVTQCHSD